MSVISPMLDGVCAFSRGKLLLATAVAAVTSVTTPVLAQSTVQSYRPSAPFRVWYGANLSHTEMTIGTAGSTDARLMEENGMAQLRWVYGSQIGWDPGPQYWYDRCDAIDRTLPPTADYPFNYVIPGIALDEWLGEGYPGVFDDIVEGLTAGREDNRDVFISIWVNGWNEQQLYDLGHTNTVDLFMTQGYTRAPESGQASGWTDAIREVEEMSQRGLEHKTVLGFGHMTDLPNYTDGSVWTEQELRDKIEFVKEDYPNLPGVAFFPGGVGDPEDYQAMVDMVNELAAEYWPDDWIPDGVYSITPQTATNKRVDAWGWGTTSGSAVRLSTSNYPNNATNQQWRFKEIEPGIYSIHPSYASHLSLDVTNAGSSNGTVVQLWANNNSNAQKWRLIPHQSGFGFLISPLCAPGKYLRFPDTNDHTRLQIWEERQDDSQLFALTPEFCPLDPIPPYYQAEDAQMTGGVTASTANYGHMGGYANMSSNNGASLTFNNVDGLDGGDHEIIIRYALANTSTPRTCNLTVNGVTTTVTFEPTGSWSTWRRKRITRSLNAGTNNTVIFTSFGQDPGDIDKITIQPNL